MSGLTPEQKSALIAGATTWTTVDGGAGLPSIHLSDGPHGVRSQGESGDNLGLGGSVPAVCFPPAVALGSTWNPALVTRVGEALGDEASGLGVHVLLGPGLNIKRSPLGGRNFEYLSEDPRLSGTLATAMVRGIQSKGVAATPKHFAVNNQETDRMRVDAIVSDRALREIYLTAFEQVVREAGPWALMSAYNRVNGPFASESALLLQQILRDEWGFDGLVVSDWGAVNDPVAAVQAGLDLEMPPSGRDGLVRAALAEGTLSEEVLDQAIDRLRTLIARTSAPSGVRDIAAAQAVALDAAREGIVLLKNDGTLPLASGADARVLVVGEFARTPRFQGGGSSRVSPTRLVSALDAIRDLAGEDVPFAPGFTLGAGEDLSLADEAVEAAAAAEVVVLFLGLPDSAESEGFDRETLALPADQLRLLERLAQTDANIVVVLSNGAVVEVAPWRDGVAAVIEGWLLGQEGGRAIAEVLFGATNPSGRLAETIPLRLEDTPSALTFPGAHGQVIYGEDIYVGYRYYDTKDVEVAYPFGFGLSYTTFSYADAAVAARGAHEWSATVTVTNTGERAGAEVVQLYIAPRAAQGRPARELRGFAKVDLAPGESREITLPITLRDLSVWDAREHRWRVDAGDYEVQFGASSHDIRAVADLHTDGDGILDALRSDSTLEEWAAHPAAAPVIEQMRQRIPAEVLERAPELGAMAKSVPVVKLTTWGLGITDDVVRDVVARSTRSPS